MCVRLCGLPVSSSRAGAKMPRRPAVTGTSAATATTPCSARLGNKFLDPFRKRESGSVDLGIVIVAFQPGALVAAGGLLDPGGRAQRLAAVAGPGEGHESADIGGHHGEIEAGAGEKLRQLLQRLGDLP